jgi:predicted acyltransferase
MSDSEIKNSQGRWNQELPDGELKPTAQPRSERLLSLDALRGFDMFWIMGGEGVVHALAVLYGWTWMTWLSGQLKHPLWDGFALYDLIFPLFLFIAGVAMPYSLGNRLARGDSRSRLHLHVIRRGLLLVLLGAIYNGLLQFDFANQRYPSVLGRIGLAYLFAGVIFLNTRYRGQAIWLASLLVGYWLAMKFIPNPDYGAGDLAPGHTLADWVDRQLIPGTLYMKVRDPEGLFSTIPAIGTALAGALTGQFLKSKTHGGLAKAGIMFGSGLVFMALAWLWNLDFPINKNLWSSSFVLYCAGLSLLLLSVFYLVIDVWKFRRWTFFFVVIGSNSILIYMLPEFIDFKYTVEALLGGVAFHSRDYGPAIGAIALVAFHWVFLLVLYRKRIFLRV